MIADLLAVLASIAYGAADFCGGVASKRTPVLAVVVWSQFAGLAVVLIALPLLPPSSPSTIDFVWGVAAGVAGGAGVALLYRALSIGVMNVVAPVTAVCAVVVPVGGGIAFGARPALLSRGSCFTNGFAPSSCSASFQQRLQSC